jgi:hypothetical protein
VKKIENGPRPRFSSNDLKRVPDPVSLRVDLESGCVLDQSSGRCKSQAVKAARLLSGDLLRFGWADESR